MTHVVEHVERLVEEALASAPDARAYSAVPSLFRSPAMRPQQLNLDTQEYMDRGAAGVQFVYFRGTTNYHTRTDDIALVCLTVDRVSG